MTREAVGSPAAFWGERVRRYDDFIRRVVPRYDEMIDRLLDYSPAAGRVLELGCGTGNLSLRLIRRRPDAEYTLVDGAPEMLELARARIEVEHPGAAARARFVLSRFEDLSPERAGYDLVIASLSLHHVEDVTPVYGEIRRALRDGGAFRMIDGIRGTTEETHHTHMERWRAFWRQPGNLSAEEIEEVQQHVDAHDHYVTLPRHFELLGAARFVEPDCAWRDGLFGLIGATASPGGTV